MCKWEEKKSTRKRSFVMLLLLHELVSFLPKLIFLRPPKAIETEQCWNAQLKILSFLCNGKCPLINNPWVRWQLSFTVFQTAGWWSVWPVADLRLPPGCSLGQGYPALLVQKAIHSAPVSKFSSNHFFECHGDSHITLVMWFITIPKPMYFWHCSG